MSVATINPRQLADLCHGGAMSNTPATSPSTGSIPRR
jgi:hypothetical protein